MPYFHVVFTLPAPIADIAYQNKAVVYDMLFKAAAETLITIAADPKHLGARSASPPCSTPGARRSPIIPMSTASSRAAVLAGWQALDRLPARLLPARAGALAPVPSPVPGKADCRLRKPGGCSSSATTPPSPSRQPSKPSSPHCARSNGWSMPSGPSADPTPSSPICPATRTASPSPTAGSSPSTATRVTFSWKDYRAKADARYKLMTLDADEFIRRFLIHVLPDGFHRIRHYGLFANANRANNIALARRLLGVPDPTAVNRGQRRHRKSSRRRGVECLSLLRRAYDHHRDLRTRLPAAAVARPIDRAR